MAIAAVAGPAMFVVGALLLPESTSDTPVPFDNPLGPAGPAGVALRLRPPLPR